MDTETDAIRHKFSTAQDSLVLQASDLSLESIANMVSDNAIDLEPQFQRRQRWNQTQQSALIESFLLNVPVPPVYLSENDYGSYSVIDGKQRITSIYSFMKGDLTLRNIDKFTLIEGMHFRDLPEALQNALRVRPYLRVITLLKQSDPSLKYEVFSRLNKGGEQLEPQEIRNVAYRGKLNELIYSLSKNRFLRENLKIKGEKSPAYQKMEDAEMVLRFFTLAETWNSFSGNYRDAMDNFMLRHRNDNMESLEEYANRFRRCIDYCKRIWEDKAFKRPEEDGWRNQMLKGMYDAQMIACDISSDAELSLAESKSQIIISKTRSLFENDEDFDTAVRRGTNSPRKVEYRINWMRQLIASL